MRIHHLAAGALAALALASLPTPSHACGGCFHAGGETESTVVVGHRMAFAMSTTHTVLWDQIQYSGDPSSFAWVLPVKAGATLELSTDAWFETLDAVTSAKIVGPYVTCDDFSRGCAKRGCGAEETGGGYGGGGGGDPGGSGVPPVTVVHQETVGPYETVTLHANVPNALPSWLSMNGYVIDPSVQPIVDAYTKEGYDFIALKLLPGAGIDQMQPVRVITPGAAPVLPLRMVAAGTGPNVPITLFVIAEGRYGAGSFENGEVESTQLTWDVGNAQSDYSTIRKQALEANEKRTWLTVYAQKGKLLSPTNTPVPTDPGFGGFGGGGGGTGTPTGPFVVDGESYDTIADAYVAQGVLDGAETITDCVSVFPTYATSNAMVVASCPTNGCSATQLDGQKLACGKLDDLTVAFTGMHPSSVWLTRLEAELPRAALDRDLALAPVAQTEKSNWLFPLEVTNSPCDNTIVTPVTATAALDAARTAPRRRSAFAGGLFTMLAAVAVGRRRRRRHP